MNVVVNGEATELRPGTTLEDLLRRLGANPDGAGIAAARNGAVVPRGAWSATELAEDDHVEVLGATQGG